ncbi:MAG: ParB/RepB/Spo0J family partition protein [Holosporales bacterium]|jgi:hypothetical protein|nr:ParB/RepB/Spo0J family partition protein [Holosporales bacterium]
MIEFAKSLLRPTWRKVYPKIHKFKTSLKTFNVRLDRLLCGGANGIRAAKYAELMDDFLLPSRPASQSPHTELLKDFDKLGMKVLQDDFLQQTEYYKYAEKCMRLTGCFFYDRPDKIKILAERFIRQYKGEVLDLPRQPGQSDAGPIWLRPIKFSSYYEIIDGHHRVARAIMTGQKTVPAILYDAVPVLTPLQQLLLDVMWISNHRWLYQPVHSPEIEEQWILVRNCQDRLDMMNNFLNSKAFNTTGAGYLDVGSSNGWFVKQMEDKGLRACGIDRDPFGIEVGFRMYGLKPEQIAHSDIAIGLGKMVSRGDMFDFTSCMSIMHHFVLGKTSYTPEHLLKLLDKITKQVMFFDTGEEHEQAFGETLNGWSSEHIQNWILSNSSFKEVIPLGRDNDRKPPFQGYYNRTLFACVK